MSATNKQQCWSVGTGAGCWTGKDAYRRLGSSMVSTCRRTLIPGQRCSCMFNHCQTDRGHDATDKACLIITRGYRRRSTRTYHKGPCETNQKHFSIPAGVVRRSKLAARSAQRWSSVPIHVVLQSQSAFSMQPPIFFANPALAQVPLVNLALRGVYW